MPVPLKSILYSTLVHNSINLPQKIHTTWLKNQTELRPDRGSNPGSSVYETDALPLGHRAYKAIYKIACDIIECDIRERPLDFQGGLGFSVWPEYFFLSLSCKFCSIYHEPEFFSQAIVGQNLLSHTIQIWKQLFSGAANR